MRESVWLTTEEAGGEREGMEKERCRHEKRGEKKNGKKDGGGGSRKRKGESKG